MRAALYSRCSTDDQAERGTSIADQVAAGRKWAEDHGHELVLEAADEGISGAAWPRPGLLSLVEAAQRGEFDELILWDWSRLARDDELHGYLRYLLRQAGVRILSISEASSSPLETGIRAVIAGEQRRRVRGDIIRAMKAKAMRGEYTGGQRLFGYRWTSRTEREIVPEEAAVVSRAFEMADPEGEHRQLATIARELGLELQRLGRILRHPGYAGAYTWGRRDYSGKRWTMRPAHEWTIHWGAHPAIVPRDRWERVQARLDDQAVRQGKSPGIASLPLTGLLRCASCGEPLRVTGMHKVRALGGIERHYYRCRSEGCPGVGRVRVDGWPRAIMRELLVYLRRPDLARAISDELRRVYDLGRQTGQWEAEVRRLERAGATLLAVMQSGEVSDTRALAREYQSTQKALERARASLRRDQGRAGVSLGPKAISARAWPGPARCWMPWEMIRVWPKRPGRYLYSLSIL